MSGRVHSRELKMTVVRQLASGEKRPAQICRFCLHQTPSLHQQKQKLLS